MTRRVLGDVLRAVGVAEDSISDILLAATEACSNVLRHGGPRVTGYAVVVTIGANRCEVEVAEDWSFAGPAADRASPGPAAPVGAASPARLTASRCRAAGAVSSTRLCAG